MSRVANSPVKLPKGVVVEAVNQQVTVRGEKLTIGYPLPNSVIVECEATQVSIRPERKDKASETSAGTVRALLMNAIIGVTKGFEKKLDITGVGYRAQLQGKVLNLTLGFSHPVNFPIPEGITIEVPSQTEILVKGSDRCLVGQVAANIRAFRPPEPYKGKGVRYANEKLIRKEAKKG